MIILNKSIRIINYENDNISQRITPDTFNEYIDELIAHINTNESVRQFKTQSNNTEVITLVFSLLENHDNEAFVAQQHDAIADRLLRKEVAAQGRVGHMHINVKKGSLIQALLFDESSNTYKYLFAKVEHNLI